MINKLDSPENDRRRGSRVPVASISLPLLGIRGNDALEFRYLLADIRADGVQIAIPGWVSARDKLLEDDMIDLCIPIRIGGRLGNRGSIKWLKWDEATKEQLCGVQILDSPSPSSSNHPISLQLVDGGAQVRFEGSQNLGELAYAALLDSELLKKSLLIYLDHLMPFFQRITNERGSNEEIHHLILDDVKARIAAKHARLREWAQKAKPTRGQDFPLPAGFDLEDLRRAMESEIPTALFRMTFEGDLILRYLEEIKRVEYRLCLNYNTLVLINILVLEGGR